MDIKRIFLNLLFPLLVCASCKTETRETIFVQDVSTPVISLDGKWMISTEIPGQEPQLMEDNRFKGVVEVPGEVIIQGYFIEHDKPFVLRRYINIPEDYSGKVVKLLFEGVYSYARVWIDEHYIRDHSGGFTAWECDITDHIKAGEKSMLTVEITDRHDEISYASGYAKHQIGGILRSVYLLALPESYPGDIVIQTDLDSEYKDAELIISGEIMNGKSDETILIELYDPAGKKVALENNGTGIGEYQFTLINNVEGPALWDAEHPNLYKLMIHLQKDGNTIYSKEYKIGFREVEVSGNQLLVNGKPVKLRGANRHDIHPRLGRVSNGEYELKDVMLAKEANFNFIRTSHYPPSEKFLEYCDKYGIYVEDETAVCFVGTHRTGIYAPGSTQSLPEYSDRYLSQLNEMIDHHRNHPSVILWSIGNENLYGENFLMSYLLVKKKDTTRPVIFSYPDKVPDAPLIYEVLSEHYPPIDGNTVLNDGREIRSFGFQDMPVLFDEYLHVPCYNKSTIIEDPNVRDFWGIGLDICWERIFEADGGLGGAIWGMIDETFMMPDTLPGFGESWGIVHKNEIPPPYAGHTVGYGEWGIVDAWRRKKPEFWNTKKAYSPVRITSDSILFNEGNIKLLLDVYNRFDHSDINELKMEYALNGTTFEFEKLPSVQPHRKGVIEVPLEQKPDSNGIVISFYDKTDMLVDIYRFGVQFKDHPGSAENEHPVEMVREETFVRFICDGGKELRFSTEDGLLQSVMTDNRELKVNGPFLNLRTKGDKINDFTYLINDYGVGWQVEEHAFRTGDKKGMVNLSGNYGNIKVAFNMVMDGSGKIKIDYRIDNIPAEFIREAGIYFQVSDEPDQLSWLRDGYWSIYPDEHISANKGNEALYPEKLNKYRQEPGKIWGYDNKSFYYDGISDEKPDELTRMVAAAKEKVHFYSLKSMGKPLLTVLGNGKVSCRLAKEGDIYVVYINNLSDYVNLGWGDYQRNIMIEGSYNNHIEIKF